MAAFAIGNICSRALPPPRGDTYINQTVTKHSSIKKQKENKDV